MEVLRTEPRLATVVRMHSKKQNERLDLKQLFGALDPPIGRSEAASVGHSALAKIEYETVSKFNWTGYEVKPYPFQRSHQSRHEYPLQLTILLSKHPYLQLRCLATKSSPSLSKIR